MISYNTLKSGLKLCTSRDFLVTLLVSLSFLIITGTAHFYTITNTEKVNRELSETLNVSLGQASINSSLNGIISDLLYLSNNIEQQGFLDQDNLRGRSILEIEFQIFSQQKAFYDQIRLLDENGIEIVRVNNNNGKPYIVATNQLQDKSHRYYFRQSWQLSRNKIYVSPMDLNVEQGQIQIPYKPMLRIATPVYNSSGEKKGVLLLNYLGERLINDFRLVTSNIAMNVSLLNNDSYWISSPDKKKEWGFMFDKKQTFATAHPNAWKTIKASENGQFSNYQGMFTFATIRPFQQQISDRKSDINVVTWRTVSFIPLGQLSILPLFKKHLPMYLTMLILILIGTALIARLRIKHHFAVSQIEYEKQFRDTLENIDLLAVSINSQNKIEFCNNALLQLTDWQREDVIGADWFSLFVPREQRSQRREIFKKLIVNKNTPLRHDSIIQKHNGEKIQVVWNYAMIQDSDRQVIGLTCIGEDVTEIRETEVMLHKLYMASEQSPAIIMIVNTQGQIEYANPKFTELTGYSFDEVKGKNPRILKSGETSNSDYSELWTTISKGQQWRGVFHNKKKNGELYWESARISAIRDTDGKITHYLAVKEDITERKRLQSELDKRNREMANSMALAATGQMVSMVAHDLRNPLSSIKMGLQILGKKSVHEWRDEEKELRGIALQQVGYMEEILDDLLSFSRPEALKPEWISIEKLLNTAVIFAQKQIRGHGIEIRSWYEPGLPTLHGDSGRLRQAFGNIIINAAQATESQQIGLQAGKSPWISISVRLELAHERPKIRIEICDNGHGIEQEQAQQLFEPFFTTRSKGTGLGLAIVKRIISQHRGDVCLQAGNEGGTCAVIILPTGSLDGSTTTNDRQAQ